VHEVAIGHGQSGLAHFVGFGAQGLVQAAGNPQRQTTAHQKSGTHDGQAHPQGEAGQGHTFFVHVFGHIQLHLNQFTDHGLQGVKCWVHGFCGVRTEGGGVAFAQQIVQLRHRCIGSLQQRLDLLHQLLLLGHQGGVHIGLPFGRHCGACLRHRAAGLLGGQCAVAGLVCRIHDVDGIHVGHDFQLLQRHDTVNVQRLHFAALHTRGVGAHGANGQHHGQQSNAQQHQLGSDFHGSFHGAPLCG